MIVNRELRWEFLFILLINGKGVIVVEVFEVVVVGFLVVVGWRF